MFEDGAKIDDILDVLKQPALTGKGNKTEQRIAEAGSRYDSRQSLSDYNVKFEFAGQKTLEVST